jgi:hypothetical protein
MRALARLITVGGPQAARAVCALASLASEVPLIRLRYEQPRHTRPVSGSGAQRGPARARTGYGASADRPARLRTDVPTRLRDRACDGRGD